MTPGGTCHHCSLGQQSQALPDLEPCHGRAASGRERKGGGQRSHRHGVLPAAGSRPKNFERIGTRTESTVGVAGMKGPRVRQGRP